ncbi:MAG: hypothetical protein WEA11_03175 [Acidimicrobiales bacterium]
MQAVPFDREDSTNPRIVDGDVTWIFDANFLQSNWTCIWGRGCLGIHDQPSEELQQGCCSVGAELDGEDESRMISALAAMIEPSMFQFHAEAQTGGVFANETATNTRVVDDACIFLNRPGFAGGAGCALHLAAVASRESPTEWKPSVCWQLPIKIDWVETSPTTESATLRRWTRADWGEEGETMAWCCTEGDRAYVGKQTVVESLANELRELLGEEVFVELKRRL